jgi:uncharacterized protein YndB with AHSA1/START domain
MTTGNDQVELTRIIPASPAQVYQAFLDPGRLSKWFGPGAFTVLDSHIDARIGGQHRTEIAGANGVRGTFECRILELIPNERIVLAWSWVAAAPQPADPPQDGSTVTVTLREAGPESTELTLTHARLGGAPDEDSAGISQAWAEALDKLAALY